ncbi:MAG: hypothetical protein PUC36_07190 [Clostridiales bacterium]|nr:hypothetical protein [Clostridiales bacterium]
MTKPTAKTIFVAVNVIRSGAHFGEKIGTAPEQDCDQGQQKPIRREKHPFHYRLILKDVLGTACGEPAVLSTRKPVNRLEIHGRIAVFPGEISAQTVFY